MNKKGFGAVVAAALLIVVSVLAVIAFQTWYQAYSSQIFTSAEISSLNNENLEFLNVVDNEIYFLNNDNISINYFIVKDIDGNEVCSYKNSNLSDGLVGYWNFDSVDDTYVYDLSDYNNDGLIFGDLNYINGKFGNAGNFDGIDDYINVGSSSELKGNLGFTYSFWIKREEDSIFTWPFILACGETHTYYGVRSHNSGDKINIEYGTSPFDGSSWANSNYHINFDNDTWTYMVFEYDGDKFIHYKNGGFVGEYETGSNILNPNIGDCKIGGGYGSIANYRGQIDEFRIYNRALNIDEIQNLKDFNSINLNFSSGLNKISFNGCDFINGDEYNLFLVSNLGSIDRYFIAD